MTPDLDPVPAGALRLATAFDRWWQAVQPSAAEALAWRRAELEEAKAGPRDASIGAAQALEALNLAGPAGKAHFAAAAVHVAREGARAAFVNILARGDLEARILQDGREVAIAPSWWWSTTFDIAARSTRAIYFDRIEFDRWAQLAANRSGATHAELVAFLLSRLPPAPGLSPTETDDFAAVYSYFGDQFKRLQIRQARDDAYADRKRGRGNQQVRNRR